MPLVRISLLKGRSPETVRLIADGVHDALVETFEVPAEDRFQIIDERDPGHILYSRSYLGIERTDGIVFVHIVASGWRDTAAKQRLYHAIADRLARAGVRPEDVQIVLSPNDRPDWSFGRGEAPYVT